MLTRICLIVAIAVGLVVGGLNLFKVKTKINTLTTQRNEERAAKEKAQTELASTRNTLNKTEADLKETKQQLDTTTAQRDKAVADAATQMKRANQLADDLSKTRKERDDAQAELASYRASGLNPQQAMSASKTIAQLTNNVAGLQDENKLLGQKIKRLENQLALYVNPNYHVRLPAKLAGKVLVSDPKWDFVVLNFGAEQGALENGELLLNRDGKLVAKVIIRSLQKNRCIANIEPGWQLGEVMEGDLAIPAYPSS